MSDCCNEFEFTSPQGTFYMDGGIRGKDGVTFYPHVSAAGILSWTNDGGKQNPDPVNIKGADGMSAYAAAQQAGFTGTEAQFNAYLSGIGELTEDVDDLKSAIDDPVTGLDTKAPAIFDTASGAIASFEDGADNMPIKSLTVNIEPVQEGSGDPSPENVRPITGWTGCNIVHGGIGDISFTPNEAIDGSGNIVASSGAGYSELISASPTDDAVVINNISAGQKRIRVHAYDASGVWLRQVATINILAGGSVGFYKIPISLENTEKYLRISTGNLTETKLVTVGHQIPITFPSPDPGTVYGGTLDVVNKKLTVDMYLVSITEDTPNLAFNAQSGQLRWPRLPYSTDYVFPAICNKYQTHHGRFGNLPDGYFLASGNTIAVKDSTYTSLESWKDVLAQNGPIDVCYTLETPLIYNLADIPEIVTLLGTNNIWADCGPVSVDYPADTKLFIERVNKPTDDDMTADTQIASGKYFIIGNTLYLSTTTIPAGDTIIPGTNCQKTNLAAALNALNT